MAQRATPACAVEYSGSGSDAVPTEFQPNGTLNGTNRRPLGVDRRLRPVQRALLGPRDVHVRDGLSQWLTYPSTTEPPRRTASGRVVSRAPSTDNSPHGEGNPHS
ncbi:hypothetical protein [Streptomyces viridochromogenes]|uniref:hypothetical protein n=1 Tax=Streptomyces viridochromogenes TaxID=1938 RepID=UPI0018FEE49D|nr:hypothetical protein [Streptomyces viridochromogenes]